MRILAVIPARAGSKGIPNKNIRIIGGHPLVYYAIRNALNSRYITDVMVSTDSPDVKIIAEQMGASVRWRDERLCGDDVTLDGVVYDATDRSTPWDYVVTMQPTSPTLKVDTLDRAIVCALERNLDTLISAANRPRLSWGVRDGKKVPNYEKRLNRQYLPPCYMETGAFMISKFSAVTPESRIGEHVDIFEVPENEALDVDTFEDLRIAEAELTGKKVAIYVNGNRERGIGHIYRALELADEFYSKPDIFYDSNQTDVSVFGKTSHSLVAVDGIGELFARCEKARYDLFINDILDTSLDYMTALRSSLPENAKIVNFEDDGEGVPQADLVINALYSKNRLPQIRSGEQYYIAGKSFMFYQPIPIREKVERILISFGGADPRNYSDRLLSIISEPTYARYHFTVVLGRVKQNVDALMEYNRFENITVAYDVSNMPELMSRCDMGITSRGRTGYEFAVLGVPTIAIAQNKREEKHRFLCNENGVTYIGLNPADEIIRSTLDMYLNLSRESRQQFHDTLLSHDLRNGRKRVMSLINNL